MRTQRGESPSHWHGQQRLPRRGGRKAGLYSSWWQEGRKMVRLPGEGVTGFQRSGHRLLWWRREFLIKHKWGNGLSSVFLRDYKSIVIMLFAQKLLNLKFTSAKSWLCTGNCVEVAWATRCLHPLGACGYLQDTAWIGWGEGTVKVFTRTNANCPSGQGLQECGEFD